MLVLALLASFAVTWQRTSKAPGVVEKMKVFARFVFSRRMCTM